MREMNPAWALCNGDHMKTANAYCDSSVDEAYSSQNQNGQFSSSNGGNNFVNNQNEDMSQRQQYSLPGILHFIQHEWARFEVERSQWKLDRAELQAKIAFLQGERKGQENLKNDLVRRIKMLEYALKQERAKYHKLKYGKDLEQYDEKPPILDENTSCDDSVQENLPFTCVSNVNWKQGRQLLRQYLQEIGYTDTIIEARSSSIRSLMDLSGNTESDDNLSRTPLQVCTNDMLNKRSNEIQGKRLSLKKVATQSVAEASLMESQAEVMESLDFLAQSVADVDDEDDENMNEDMEETQEEDQDDDQEDDDDIEKCRRKEQNLMLAESSSTEDVDREAEEVINELNLLSETGNTGIDNHSQNDSGEWNGVGMEFKPGLCHKQQKLVPKLACDEIDSKLIVSEFTKMTSKENEEPEFMSLKEPCRKTWNPKHTLRSHFDGVRALAFHPTESIIITASEDHTLKMWNLQKSVTVKKTTYVDIEPQYTFRRHKGPVLRLVMHPNGEEFFSGGVDGCIYCWKLPCSSVDPYDAFDPGVVICSLEGHTDAVWGLSMHSQLTQLLSCSADGTVKLWAPTTKTPLRCSYASEKDGVPTSVDYVRDESTHMVAAFTSAHCIVFDLETGQQVIRLDINPDKDSNIAAKQINRVVAHPTLPFIITAHEDRHIRFFDSVSGKQVHSMVAHLDAVTSLAVDPNGLYLLSGSHDCSVRIWNLENKTCVQEITAHRKKFDESIFDVAFHASKPLIASAGADALAKVFD